MAKHIPSGRIHWNFSALENQWNAPAFETLNSRSMFNASKKSSEGVLTMNWDTVEGNWKQLKGKVKEQWGNLTDDELDKINGNREQLEGQIQARYGYGKDEAKKAVDDWFSRM